MPSAARAARCPCASRAARRRSQQRQTISDRQADAAPRLRRLRAAARAAAARRRSRCPADRCRSSAAGRGGASPRSAGASGGASIDRNGNVGQRHRRRLRPAALAAPVGQARVADDDSGGGVSVRGSRRRCWQIGCERPATLSAARRRARCRTRPRRAVASAARRRGSPAAMANHTFWQRTQRTERPARPDRRGGELVGGRAVRADDLHRAVDGSDRWQFERSASAATLAAVR